jgi:hypothetical protein
MGCRGIKKGSKKVVLWHKLVKEKMEIMHCKGPTIMEGKGNWALPNPSTILNEPYNFLPMLWLGMLEYS